jgi:hypothetical protein
VMRRNVTRCGDVAGRLLRYTCKSERLKNAWTLEMLEKESSTCVLPSSASFQITGKCLGVKVTLRVMVVECDLVQSAPSFIASLASRQDSNGCTDLGALPSIA